VRAFCGSLPEVYPSRDREGADRKQSVSRLLTHAAPNLIFSQSGRVQQFIHIRVWQAKGGCYAWVRDLAPQGIEPTPECRVVT
jgi:hypothetical protein